MINKFLRCLFACQRQKAGNVAIKRRFSSIKSSYFHQVGKEKLLYRTLGQQLDITAEQYPDVEAIVSCQENKRMSYAALRDTSNRLAASLLKIGLKKGDRVAIWAPNSSTWYLTAYALAKAGLVLVSVNSVYKEEEIVYSLRKVGVKAIVAPEVIDKQEYYKILSTICPELKSAKEGDLKSDRVPTLNVVIVDSKNKLPGALNFDTLLNLADKDDIEKMLTLQRFIIPDDPYNIMYTSGTTGQSKAAVSSHFALLNNGYLVGKDFEGGSHRVCSQLPLFHAFAFVVSVTSPLCWGGTAVIPCPFHNPSAILRAILVEKCSLIFGTPTMYVDLVKRHREMQLSTFGSLRFAASGGAPCSPQLIDDIKETLGAEIVGNLYGLTESSGGIFRSSDKDEEELLLSTVGRLYDHCEAKIVDVHNNLVPIGQPGELCIRCPFLITKYFDDERKTKEAIDEHGWLHTGDQFILHENGYGQILGRIKDVIIRGGENIYPREIEDFLNKHPDILETHVIGVEDDRLGEAICAYIRLKDFHTTVTLEEITRFCTGHIAHYKIPKYLRIVDTFPKTGSGKIQKGKLKELFLKKRPDVSNQDVKLSMS